MRLALTLSLAGRTGGVSVPDTTAPVVNSFSYNNSTQTVSLNVTEASGSSTVYWATVANPSTPTGAQIKAGTGGGILDSGSFTATSGGDTDVVSVSDTTADEIHIYLEDGSGNNTGNPSALNNTIATGVVVYPTPYAATGVADATPASSTLNHTVDMEPGMNEVTIFSGLGGGQTLTSVSIDGNAMTKRAENVVVGTNTPLVKYSYFHSGAKSASVTLSIVHTGTPFQHFYQMSYLGNVAWVSSDHDPTTASYSQTNDVSQNTSANDIIVVASYLRDNSYTAGDTTLTGATKSYDGVIETTRFAVTGYNFAATGGTPETITSNMGAAPGFEHISVSDIYRPN